MSQEMNFLGCQCASCQRKHDDFKKTFYDTTIINEARDAWDFDLDPVEEAPVISSRRENWYVHAARAGDTLAAAEQKAIAMSKDCPGTEFTISQGQFVVFTDEPATIPKTTVTAI